MKTNQPNDALRYQRLLRGWSLQHVVDELCAIGIKANGKKPGVNVDMVSSWERGVKTPSPYYREKLCLLYGIPANQLNLIPLGATQLPTTLIFSRNLVDDMDKKRREVEPPGRLGIRSALHPISSLPNPRGPAALGRLCLRLSSRRLRISPIGRR